MNGEMSAYPIVFAPGPDVPSRNYPEGHAHPVADNVGELIG